MHVTPTVLLQLVTTANQRSDVPREWLWDACLLARICQGTRCKGICNKEGLHYCIKQSGRNSLELDQVQTALGKSSRSYNRWVWKSLEDSFPKLYCIDLAEAYVTQGSASSRILCEKKSFGSRSPNRHMHQKPSAKGRNGKENRYWVNYQVPASILLWEFYAFCARNMGAHIQRTTL